MKKVKKGRIGTSFRDATLSFFILLALALNTAPAAAYETHLPLPFSPITGAGTGVTIQVAGGVATDESTGNLFLAEPLGAGTSAVDIFGAEGGVPAGLLLPYRITGLNAKDARTFASDLPFSNLTIDNSASSPNRGTLYVAEQGETASSRKVRKFVRSAATEKYEPAGDLKASFLINGEKKPFDSPSGIAVDAVGNIYVADAGPNIKSIAKFDPDGTQTATISMANLQTGENSYIPRSIALDSAGDLFVQVSRLGNPGNPFTKVLKYSVDEFGKINEGVREVVYEGSGGNEQPEDVYAIAVDPTTATLYVALRSKVLQFDADTLAAEGGFGTGVFETGIRISRMTVNGATGNIYVSDNGPFHGGPGKVNVFGPTVKLPTVTPEPPTDVIATKATLNAAVDPTGIELDDCHFEYLTDAQYQADGKTFASAITVPCEGAAPGDVSAAHVTAEITGLIPGGVNYRWRISAANENGTHFEEGPIFPSGPPVLTEPATDVTGAKAILNGVVLPQGQAVTECKFEYGSDKTYGDSVPCEGAIPTDEGEHTVSAPIDQLLANGTIYHFRIVTDGDAGVVVGNDETLITAETFVTDPASALTPSTATLNGTVNLEGVPLTGCRFEYGLTDAYGSSAPCVPPFSLIPSDFADHLVIADVTGLENNATYHFRLVAENALGTIRAADQSFKTQGSPLITEQTATPVGVSEGLLEGYVDPVGLPATYHFEWGTDQSYGSRAPSGPDPDIAPGPASIRVSESLSGLEPDTTYHYRLVATNVVDTTLGPDQTFSTPRAESSCSNAAIRAGQKSSVNPSGTTSLPDCMALEMVSPPKKFNQRIDSPNFSVSGDALQFISLAALAETPQLGSQNDPYVATRTASGWDTHAVQPPPGISLGDAPPCSYDLELRRWSLLARPGVGAENLGIVEPMSGGLGSGFSPLGPTVTPLNTSFDYAGCEASPGGSVNGSSLFFRAEGASYLPGDPTTSAKATASSSNTYEAALDDVGNPTIELLSRDAAGTVYGGACGTDVGWLGTGDRRATRGAISPDGSRVYFTTRPSQGSGPCQSTPNKQRVMKRVQTASGPQISELVVSECARVSPACDMSDGNDNFMAASQEGDKVFFTTTRQLVDGDLDSGTTCQVAPATGCDLYLHDASLPVGSRLIQVSAGDSTNPTPGKGAGVLGLGDVAGDGSHAYFVASGLLTTNPNAQGANAELGKPNLYLYERDATYPGGRTAFIATLETGEGELFEGPGRNGMAAVPRLGGDLSDLSVGGDGHVLFFSTKAKLVPGDTDGGLDGYRYDADSGSLERITKAAPGGADNGVFDADGLFSTGEGRAPQDVSFHRTVSEDGSMAVFMSAEALDPRDADGKLNVYIWRSGQVTAVTGSLASKRGETFTVSMSGQSVAFVSDAQLLAADGDGAKDIYVARAGGGFLPPPPLPICEEEDCQAPFREQPRVENPPSETMVDPGNLPPVTSKCRKGFVRKHGKCVKPGRKKGGHKNEQKRHAKSNGRSGK